MKFRLIAAAFIAALALTPCAAMAQTSAAQAQREAESDAAQRLRQLEVVEAGRAAVAEKVAEDRASSDLIAQQQMAASAQHLAGLTLFQVLIAAAGTAVLVWTIAQANQSMKLSAASLDQNGKMLALTQRHAEIQLKAYLDLSEWSVEDFDAGPNVMVRVTNRGQTPAKNVDIIVACEFMPFAEIDPQWKEIPEVERLQIVNSLVPTASVFPGHTFPMLADADKEAFAAGSAGFWLRGVITYEDVFGGKYRKRFSAVFSGARAGRSRLSRFGNDEVELPTT